jgi:hypothetical protein
MLIETNEAVIVSEGEDFAATLLGGIWVSFKDAVPAPQAKILTDGFNLILLSEPESLMPGVITEILIGEEYDTNIKKKQIYELITNNIIDVLTKMGFIINLDEVTHERVEQLIEIGNFFYEMDNYEDLIGLGDVLDSTDIPPVSRFLLILQKYLGDNADLGEHELLIEDVSEVTLKAVRDNLKQADVEDGIPETLIKRIRANVENIRGTYAFQHVTSNGRVGSSVDTLLSFFKPELQKLIDYPDHDNLVQYGKEVIAIYLISELNDQQMRDQLLVYLNNVVTDHLALIAIEQLVEKLEELTYA